ncbi:MAG: hypothetical protein COX19_15365 [Desulfobacterales bacterium CG23_combo_of_CG06-09_8_20_14_all_51_8]|nr:MAG: hypothetical protein COX19_15365 [Desulfobacterales bacterium CG23_combo_of_CG06-09_8_20_14_all_51_8]
MVAVKATRYIILLILLIPAWFIFDGSAFAEPLQADAIVQADSVYVGDPFPFLIQVSGSDQPEPPDLSCLNEFFVQYQGGSQNNSSSITIINGKMTKSVSRGYVFSYQLTPKQTGTLTIPAIPVQADGQTLRTRPISINVLEPEKTDDIKLQLFLSRDQCYAGEPVTFTLTWYLRADVRSFNFIIPLLDKTDWFYFIDPDIDQKPDKKYYRIPLSDGEVIAEEGKESLGGTVYSTISFSKILIPKKSGDLTIDPATVACEILAGYRSSQRRNPFGDDFFSGGFDDNFFRTRQGVFKKVVVPSNALRLTINEVPGIGKPANFAGHVGEYQISADAAPTDVNVGDPITLTVTLSGPDYLDHVTLPPLTNQADLTRDFKIPQEQAAGETRGKTKVFTQTIRALRPDVTQIPAIELPYFDTSSGRYNIARTKPIPVTVKETRIITALDAEGRILPVENSSEVETWTQGIAYNYEDLSVIQNQGTGFSLLRSPVWMASVSLPPGLYLLLLLTTTIIRRKQADPLAALAKKAYAGLRKDLKKAATAESESAKTDRIFDALRHYLGARLRMSAQAIVFSDVCNMLSKQGAPAELLKSLKSIFEACEAGRYSGATGYAASALSEKTLEVAQKLEKLFK